MSDLTDTSFDIMSLHTAFHKGVSAADAVKEAFRRIEVADDPGIFIHLRPREDVLAEAEALPPFDPESYPLWGLPFAIKDNIDLVGTPTTAACPAYAYDPEKDAFVVDLLRRAGAIAIGKTNLDQFATGLVGVRTPYPIPRNALDPEIVPGGSSSGSAVAVSRGLVTFALGTDTAGSGRVPAGLNNIVGLKPTLGALSPGGVVPACRTLDTISVFALTVPDAFTVFSTASAYDEAEPYSRRLSVSPLAPVPPNLRIGVPDAATREFFGDEAQARSFEFALGRLAESGADIEEIDFTPFYEVARMLYEGAWVAERMSVIDVLLRNNPDAILPVTRKIIGSADGLSALDTFRGIYRLAELRRRAEPLLEMVDILCVPTFPTFYTLVDLENDPVGPNARLGTYTNFVNLMDLCGIAVPTGPREDGRPGSVTLLAPGGRDGLAASVADMLHRDTSPELGATGHALTEKQAKSPASLKSGEVAIAVVGAHMSGLPLNGELTSRGGRFLEVTKTEPGYRLYALSGGPPERPGLLRSAGGAEIALEIWALPEHAFGSLVSSVPPPLGIGTVRVAGGRSVKGFLVESEGTIGTVDITDHGGWRAYCSAVSR